MPSAFALMQRKAYIGTMPVFKEVVQNNADCFLVAGMGHRPWKRENTAVFQQ